MSPDDEVVWIGDGEDCDEDKKRRYPGKGFALCRKRARGRAEVLDAWKLEVGQFFFFDGSV